MKLRFSISALAVSWLAISASATFTLAGMSGGRL